jgi:hypothetical protein
MNMPLTQADLDRAQDRRTMDARAAHDAEMERLRILNRRAADAANHCAPPAAPNAFLTDSQLAEMAEIDAAAQEARGPFDPVTAMLVLAIIGAALILLGQLAGVMPWQP